MCATLALPLPSLSPLSANCPSLSYAQTNKQSTVAILYTPTTLLIIDLDTLQAQDPIPLASATGGEGRTLSEPAIICKQGIHFLVFASYPSLSSSPNPEDPPAAELHVRPLFCLPSSSSSSSTPAPPSSSSNSTPLLTSTSHSHSHHVTPATQVRVDDAHSAGRLEKLQGGAGVRGLREVADDLIAWDEEGVLVCLPTSLPPLHALPPSLPPSSLTGLGLANSLAQHSSSPSALKQLFRSAIFRSRECKTSVWRAMAGCWCVGRGR